MRYNDYKHDPLSMNEPEESIASRKDLSEYNAQCRGAIDAKVTSINDIKGKKNKKITIISGPTTNQQEPFDSSTAKCTKSQDMFVFHGITQKFHYRWIEYETKLF